MKTIDLSLDFSTATDVLIAVEYELATRTHTDSLMHQRLLAVRQTLTEKLGYEPQSSFIRFLRQT